MSAPASPATASPPTGRAAMAEAVRRLEAAGVPGVPGDALALIAHAYGSVPRHALHAELARPLPPEVAARFEAAIAARAARQPVAQITGQRQFWRHSFTVTPDTLDPRPETETLVAAALTLPWRTVLDLGTGTGAILLSLLAERPGTRGLGVDLSPAALAVARGNAERLGIAADLAVSDWFAAVTGRFELIVSNPPYIALSEMPDLAPEVREWEPHSALTDFGDGLSAYRAIAAGAGAHLAPGGHMLVEIGWQQGPEVAAIFADAGAQVAVLPDLDGRDRVVHAHFAATPA